MQNKLKNLAIAVAAAALYMTMPQVGGNVAYIQPAKPAVQDVEEGYDLKAETLKICTDSIYYNINTRIRNKNCRTDDYVDAMRTIGELLDIVETINPQKETALAKEYRAALMNK